MPPPQETDSKACHIAPRDSWTYVLKVYADNFFLPFARLLFRTRRPPFVFIRSRKPCVFLRQWLFGWYVIFIQIHLPKRILGTADTSSDSFSQNAKEHKMPLLSLLTTLNYSLEIIECQEFSMVSRGEAAHFLVLLVDKRTFPLFRNELPVDNSFAVW